MSSAIGHGPAIACLLDGDGCLGRCGQLSLNPGCAARRVEHLEEPVVDRFGSPVVIALADAFAHVAGGRLDACSLPRNHHLTVIHSAEPASSIVATWIATVSSTRRA